jgi:DNA-binding LacI/PurR family transcriptional regulator
MRKPISLKEIARLADVTHPTVSRALRNSPLISQATADRIRKIAAEYDYQPNRNARGLVTRQNNLIGCVVSDFADPFVSEVVSGLEKVAAEHEFSLVLTSCGVDPKREAHAVRSLVERAVDGVLVVAAMAGGKHSPYFVEREIPIVLVNNHFPGENIHSIGIENREGARQILTHLLDLGHQRIAYIRNRRGGEADKDRYEGYRAALKKARVRYSPEFVCFAESTLESGYLGMQRLLGLGERPTAVFCFDDITAYGASKAIRDAGLRIPADISLAGFDDLMYSSYFDPPLTTLRQPMREMGEQAMHLLLESIPQIRAGRTPAKKRILLPGKLMARQSTAAAR